MCLEQVCGHRESMVKISVVLAFLNVRMSNADCGRDISIEINGRYLTKVVP